MIDAYPFVLDFILLLSLFLFFFPPYNVDCIGIAFFRPMLIDFLSHAGINKRGTYGKIDIVYLEENRERISMCLTI